MEYGVNSPLSLLLHDLFRFFHQSLGSPMPSPRFVTGITCIYSQGLFSIGGAGLWRYNSHDARFCADNDSGNPFPVVWLMVPQSKG